MLYSKREYALTTNPVCKQITSQAEKFLTDKEKILYTFDGDEVVAFFTNKKIIFVSISNTKFMKQKLCPIQALFVA